jgi:hypothetical protein
MFENILENKKELLEKGKTSVKTQTPAQIALEKFAKKSGFEIKSLLLMKKGDEAVFEAFEKKKHVHKEVAKCIIGSAMDKKNLVKSSLLKICKIVNIPQHLAHIIIQLIFNPSSCSVRKATKVFATRFNQ